MNNTILKLALENAEIKRDVCKQYVTTARNGSKVYDKYAKLLVEYTNIINVINKQLGGV